MLQSVLATPEGTRGITLHTSSIVTSYYQAFILPILINLSQHLNPYCDGYCIEHNATHVFLNSTVLLVELNGRIELRNMNKSCLRRTIYQLLHTQCHTSRTCMINIERRSVIFERKMLSIVFVFNRFEIDKSSTTILIGLVFTNLAVA